MATIVHSLHERRVVTSAGMELPDWRMRFGGEAVQYATGMVATTHERVGGSAWCVTRVKVTGGRRLRSGGVSEQVIQSEEWYEPLNVSRYDSAPCPEWLREFAGQWLEQFNAEDAR